MTNLTLIRAIIASPKELAFLELWYRVWLWALRMSSLNLVSKPHTAHPKCHTVVRGGIGMTWDWGDHRKHGRCGRGLKESRSKGTHTSVNCIGQCCIAIQYSIWEFQTSYLASEFPFLRKRFSKHVIQSAHVVSCLELM